MHQLQRRSPPGRRSTCVDKCAPLSALGRMAVLGMASFQVQLELAVAAIQI